MKGKGKGNNIKKRLTISKYCKAVDKQKFLYFASDKVWQLCSSGDGPA